MTALVRRRSKLFFFLWSVFFLIDHGTSQDVIFTPSSSFSAPAVRPSAASEPASVTRNRAETKDCLDGVDSMMSNSMNKDEHLIKERQQQQALHDSFASWITGTQNIYTLLYIDTFQYDQHTISSEQAETSKQASVRGLAASRNIQKGVSILILLTID